MGSAGILARLTLAEVKQRLLDCFAAEFGVELAPAAWSGEERRGARLGESTRAQLPGLAQPSPPAPASPLAQSV